jgi:hypothetical protein
MDAVPYPSPRLQLAEANAVSYTLELRPHGSKGLGGFVLLPEQIRPTCDEAIVAAERRRTHETASVARRRR